MPHHLAFEARVRGPAIGPTIPAVVSPTVHPCCTCYSSFPGIPHLCCSSSLLFIIYYHSPSLSMALPLSLSQCCTPPSSLSPPFVVPAIHHLLCDMHLGVVVIQKRGLLRPCEQTLTVAAEQAGYRGGLGGVSSRGGWAMLLSTNKNLKRRKKC